MTERIPEPFPEAFDDGNKPFREIAEFLGCTEIEVLDAFKEADVLVPEWVSKESLMYATQAAKNARQGERLANELVKVLRKMPEVDYLDFKHLELPTECQLMELHAQLKRDAEFYERTMETVDRTGGQDAQAHAIAQGVKQLFLDIGKKVTFGTMSELPSAPSTEFGRAVEFALSSFGSSANWRRPAQKAAT